MYVECHNLHLSDVMRPGTMFQLYTTVGVVQVHFQSWFANGRYLRIRWFTPRRRNVITALAYDKIVMMEDFERILF